MKPARGYPLLTLAVGLGVLGLAATMLGYNVWSSEQDRAARAAYEEYRQAHNDANATMAKKVALRERAGDSIVDRPPSNEPPAQQQARREYEQLDEQMKRLVKEEVQLKHKWGSRWAGLGLPLLSVDDCKVH